MSAKQLLIQLSAFCITDGCVTTDSINERFSRIIFTNKSKALLECFADIVERLGYSWRMQKCKRADQIVVRSSELASKLLKLTPTYRTKQCDHSPKCPKINDKQRIGACLNCTPLKYEDEIYPPTIIPTSSLNQRDFAKNS